MKFGSSAGWLLWFRDVLEKGRACECDVEFVLHLRDIGDRAVMVVAAAAI